MGEGLVGWGPRVRFLSWPEQAIIVLRNPTKMRAEKLQPDLSMRASEGRYTSIFAMSMFALLRHEFLQ